MDRKIFIKNCAFACLGSASMAGLLQSCSAARIMNGKIVGDNLVVPLSDFEMKGGKEKRYKNYLVLQNDILKYPVCVYRHNENEYTALWMQCTHQGTELQVFGDKLQCPAHGSEFSSKGSVQNGPAGMQLRSFPIGIENNQLNISLKAL